MKGLTLDDAQYAKLLAHKKRIQWRIFGKSLLIPISMLLISFVPTKFLSFKAKNFSDVGASSFFESIGGVNVILIFCGLAALFITVQFFAYNYLNVLKDVESRNKIRLEVRFKKMKIIDDYGTKYYDLYFYPAVEGRSKIRFLEEHPLFHFLKPDKEVIIEVTEKAFYPLNLFPFES